MATTCYHQIHFLFASKVLVLFFVDVFVKPSESSEYWRASKWLVHAKKSIHRFCRCAKKKIETESHFFFLFEPGWITFKICSVLRGPLEKCFWNWWASCEDRLLFRREWRVVRTATVKHLIGKYASWEDRQKNRGSVELWGPTYKKRNLLRVERTAYTYLASREDR